MPKKRSFKHMRAVASQLPVQFQEGAMVIKGEELIKARGAVGKDAAEEKIDSEKWYRIATQQEVNHYRRIKKLFNQGGYQAVKTYIDEVVQLHAEAAVQHANVLAGMPAGPTL